MRRFEAWLGTRTLRTLAWLGRRALARGDLHEAAHCEAGVLVAHSTHTDDWPCCVIAVDNALRENKRWAENRKQERGNRSTDE